MSDSNNHCKDAGRNPVSNQLQDGLLFANEPDTQWINLRFHLLEMEPVVTDSRGTEFFIHGGCCLSMTIVNS